MFIKFGEIYELSSFFTKQRQNLLDILFNFFLDSKDLNLHYSIKFSNAQVLRIQVLILSNILKSTGVLKLVWP
jgi:hypothetical protein